MNNETYNFSYNLLEWVNTNFTKKENNWIDCNESIYTHKELIHIYSNLKKDDNSQNADNNYVNEEGDCFVRLVNENEDLEKSFSFKLKDPTLFNFSELNRWVIEILEKHGVLKYDTIFQNGIIVIKLFDNNFSNKEKNFERAYLKLLKKMTSLRNKKSI